MTADPKTTGTDPDFFPPFRWKWSTAAAVAMYLFYAVVILAHLCGVQAYGTVWVCAAVAFGYFVGLAVGKGTNNVQS